MIGPTVDPLQMILWDNIGYLIDDDLRARLFDRFGREIGFDAGRILQADDKALLAIAEKGGMRPADRVERWREIARLVLADGGGDLEGKL